MKMKLLSLFVCLGCFTMHAQDYFPKNDGVKSKNENYVAFTNAKIHQSPSQVISNGTLLIQNGKIVACGSKVSIPKNAIVQDLNGKSIYASFIDVFSNFGIKKPEKAKASGRSAQYDASRDGFYWNDHIMPENAGIDHFTYSDKKAKELRKLGFGVVNTHIQDGIARGTGVLVALNDDGDASQRILDDKSAQYFSFQKSIAKLQSYPTSLMGATALLRQLYHDADWYGKGNVETKDRSIEALLANKPLPQIFAAGSNGNVLRANAIGKQFNVPYTIMGAGDEYEYLTKIKGSGAQYIIPLNFPKAYEVSDPYQAQYVSLKDMRHWNLAPSNPKKLADADVDFAFTLHGLESQTEFKDKLAKAIAHGLSKTKALEALTTLPAKVLGKSAMLGTLEPGKFANFIITSGDVFDKETTLYENWVQGSKNVITDMALTDIRGDYTLKVGGQTFDVAIKGQPTSPKVSVKRDTLSFKSKSSYANNWLNLSFNEGEKVYRLNALVGDNSKAISGKLIQPSGAEGSFVMNQTNAFSAEEKKESDSSLPETVSVMYPNVGLGQASLPKTENILFKNATVWTGDAIMENTDVLVKSGKISKIGSGLNLGGAKVVDATDKHLTAGIVDEHSHIAGLSINEAGHNSSAEVRMTDVVDPKDVDIYRNLAGGVTTIQLLHGSANPIGGQSAILRLKWGEDAEGLVFQNMPKFIKFALGENVKQSNWQSYSRFPQTRMGVEQVFMDYFQRAKEYDVLKKSGKPFRYDEEMEAIAEILRGERFISCHSYVQSEINMLMKVADKFDFTVATFTHILEGYKVADKMAEHGVGGSPFSDWWAYKYEVNDAIPYNAAIMAEQGVTVAINSDDAEMSRRLNQEAAKTVKYGGMSEIEAWKTVTLNPAKLLHVDDRVGSIEVGKDADLVLWSGHPMSVYTKAEKTLIEGDVYFDLEKDKVQRAAIQEERSKLIALMLDAKAKGAKTQSPKQNQKPKYHCDSL